jgi:hypothetical protein
MVLHSDIADAVRGGSEACTIAHDRVQPSVSLAEQVLARVRGPETGWTWHEWRLADGI